MIEAISLFEQPAFRQPIRRSVAQPMEGQTHYPSNLLSLTEVVAEI